MKTNKMSYLSDCLDIVNAKTESIDIDVLCEEDCYHIAAALNTFFDNNPEVPIVEKLNLKYDSLVEEHKQYLERKKENCIRKKRNELEEKLEVAQMLNENDPEIKEINSKLSSIVCCNDCSSIENNFKENIIDPMNIFIKNLKKEISKL